MAWWGTSADVSTSSMSLYVCSCSGVGLSTKDLSWQSAPAGAVTYLLKATKPHMAQLTLEQPARRLGAAFALSRCQSQRPTQVHALESRFCSLYNSNTEMKYPAGTAAWAGACRLYMVHEPQTSTNYQTASLRECAHAIAAHGLNING